MFGKIMEQMQKAQENLKNIKDELAKITVTGEAGAGMVKVSMNGLGEVLVIDIEPSLYQEDNRSQVIPDLIKAAINSAKEKIDREKAEKSKEMMSKLGLPDNFNLPM